MKRKVVPSLLILLVLIDIVCSFVFWKYCGMLENNPLMLWALKEGWVYWFLSMLKLGAVSILWLVYPRLRIVTVAFSVVYFVVWFQFFLGSLI